MRVQGFGVRVQGSGSEVKGYGITVRERGEGVWDSGFRGSGLGVRGSGLGVTGHGSRVRGKNVKPCGCEFLAKPETDLKNGWSFACVTRLDDVKVYERNRTTSPGRRPGREI